MRYIYNYIITLQVTFKSIAFALLYHLLSFKQSYKQDCPQDINTVYQTQLANRSGTEQRRESSIQRQRTEKSVKRSAASDREELRAFRVLRRALRPLSTDLGSKSVKSPVSSVCVPLRLRDSGQKRTSAGQRRAARTGGVLCRSLQSLCPATAYRSASAIVGRDTPAPG